METNKTAESRREQARQSEEDRKTGHLAKPDTYPAEEFIGIPGSGQEPEWEPSQHRSAGKFVGRGPRFYKRPDDRIIDDICEGLARNGGIDATNIQISSADGVVRLFGTVHTENEKRLAENVAADVFGVCEVNNEIGLHAPTQDLRSA